jgi:tetratricopeptide (TPR) repeat protein
VDVSTQKVIKVVSSDASSASVVLPAVNALAKKIDASAIDFSTNLTPAWQAVATAESNNNPQQRAQFLNQAISRDPNFGFAWILLMEMIVPNRQTDLKNMIDEGKTHRASFTPYDKAKFDVSLNRLSDAAPADQIKADQDVLKLAPNDLQMITMLGNYQILQGDGAAGEQSLRRASTLNPANISLRFQLARGLMELRKYKDAETILSSIDKTPAVYPELATVILLEGDKARAETTVNKFIDTVQNNEIKPLLHGAWAVMAGDREKGIALAQGATFKEPNLQELALGQISIWQLMGSDYAGVQKTIAMMTKIPSPQPSPLPVLMGLLADKTSSASDWQNKVQGIGMPDGIKQPILAYGFFLRGNYDDAVKAWQQVNDKSHGEDLHARAMLASSLEHAGKKADAQRINVLPFTPEFTDLYSAISFTEMRRMQGK